MTTQSYAWHRREGEPITWYKRFIEYYLPLGPTRTLLQASVLERAINTPDKIDKDSKPNTAPNEWTKACDDWDWRVRADAYDAFMYEDDGMIELALEKLRNSALDAVTALHDSLQNPRYAVAAAKEILDRAGLPATTNINLGGARFTADDLSKANEELKEWQDQTAESEKESSG